MSKVIGIVLFVFLFSCSKKVEEVDLNLSELDKGAVFRLDTINMNDWNNLYVIKPYSEVDTKRCDIPETVLKKLKTVAMTDGYCSLLFLKDRQLINYSFVIRSTADFSRLEEGKDYPSNQKYKLSEEREIIEFE